MKLSSAIVLIPALIPLSALAWFHCRTIHRWLTIKRVCAWCKKYQGGNPILFGKGHVSHSMCPACFEKTIKEMEAVK